MRRYWPDALVEIGRIFRFGIVGIAATLSYAILTFAGVEWLGLTAVGASVISHVITGIFSYLGHALYSFRVEGDHRVFVWRFIVIAILAIAVNVLVTSVVTDVIGASYRIAIAIVSILIPATNYVANRFWVFLPGITRP